MDGWVDGWVGGWVGGRKGGWMCRLVQQPRYRFIFVD